MSLLDKIKRQQGQRFVAPAVPAAPAAPAAAPPSLARSAFSAAARVPSAAPAQVPAQVPTQAPSPAASLLSKVTKNARAVEEAGAHQEYAEVRRIVDLRITQSPEPAEVEAFCEKRLLSDAMRSGFRLHPTQVWAIKEFEELEGLFAPIGVGWGKTLITLMAAESGYRKMAKRKILLLVPTQVYQQLVGVDISWARRRVPLSVPFIMMGQTTAARRRVLAQSGKTGCYILPYSCLSTKDTSEVLAAIAPSLVILDEAHLVRHRSSARTRRLLQCLDQYRPKVVALSGTITNKSILDYHHVIRRALGDGSPLPLSIQLAQEWAAVLDSDAANASSAAVGPIRPLVEWAQRNFPYDQIPETRAGFRRAFRRRLTTCPGVVSTGDAEIGTSLVISNEPPFTPTNTKEEEKGELELYDGGDLLSEYISQVDEMWVTPNGDELEHAIHAYKWLYELSSGFFNELVWPTAQVYAARKRISEQEAEDLLLKARAHHVAQQNYNKVLRSWLKERAEDGIDTPLLVGAALARTDNRIIGSREGRDLLEAWREVKEKDFEDRPERDSRAVRVCSFKIDAMVKWAKALKPGVGALVWVYHQEIGIWAVEALKAAGVDVVHCPAGQQYDRAILDPQNFDKIVVASMSAHGTGKNLQPFQHTYFLQWPRQATLAEQTIGRNHRIGQEAEELTMVTAKALKFDELVFAACVEDALYIHTTTGNRQKLIYCAYDPLPRMFSSEVLEERGLQPNRLSDAQKQILEEKFGEIVDSV